jgi:glycosyltransferase involved in cell wall biosynthesis
VPSAAVFMQQYDLMLAPLLSGGGMRIKIIEGMALGKCILTTTVGAEGILCQSGENILISDDPSQWVAFLKQYGAGRLHHRKIGEQAQQLIIRKYDNQAVVQLYLQLYQDLR